MKLFSKLDSVLVRVRDLPSSRDWYLQKLGFEAGFESDELAVLKTSGEATLTLWRLEPGESLPPPESAGTFPMFFPEDFEVARNALLGAGVEVGPVETDGKARWFSLWDPDGNRIDVCRY